MEFAPITDTPKPKGTLMKIVRLFPMSVFFLCWLNFPLISEVQAKTKRAPNKSAKISALMVRHKLKPASFFPVPETDIIVLPPPSVKVPPNEQQIQLKMMNISVEISGLESETTTLMTFHNPNNRVLEGNLEFPLPNESSVSGYALDINGHYRRRRSG
jgi:hypothetical protein